MVGSDTPDESIDWRPLAAKLADTIEAEGYADDPAVKDAFANTPRHRFLPGFYDWEDNAERWIDHTDPHWLDKVYTDLPWLTQYKPTADGPPSDRWPTSSSTTPSLMADMINELDLRPGLDVLEIGTGTGYNAAILSRLLGDQHVTTVDIDPALVALARTRLAELGHHPRFEAIPDSYDRILATHAVEHIPYQWIDWSRPGARILTDLRSASMPHVGAWAVLTVDDAGTSATGHLIPARGSFMNARDEHDYAPATTKPQHLDHTRLRRRRTDLPPDVLHDPDFAFFLWRHVPGICWNTADGRTTAHEGTGRWATRSPDGTVAYMLLGDTWATIEDAYRLWHGNDRPELGDWTLRATADGTTLAETEDLHDPGPAS